ncbi:Glutaredoxin [Rheinheimera pacifica]|uniref:Methylamine utilization protein MauE n=1 Tax=Rheinheimera pacifica TaxID=173990 RepID=A0A1H6JTA8_9GAMM|nr:glutaredoxin [Rheinheimera pacifica]SEH65765.1 Glutaredoxin [Rheinheimera pacifica]
MTKHATLYRMKTDEHICPFGLKSKYLLRQQGFTVTDHLLTSRKETDGFKQQHDVKTTPQTFIDGKRIGGYDDLRRYFDKPPAGQQGTSYTPVIAVFATALLTALAIASARGFSGGVIQVTELFVALAMIMLAIQKLRDLYTFSNSFITYDLLAMKLIPYAYIYPFLEAYAGLGMIAGLSAILVAPVAILIGTVGAISVIKAVYIDKRELTCACVGGDSKVPLGFVSLTENLFMLAAGVWMFMR